RAFAGPSGTYDHQHRGREPIGMGHAITPYRYNARCLAHPETKLFISSPDQCRTWPPGLADAPESPFFARHIGSSRHFIRQSEHAGMPGCRFTLFVRTYGNSRVRKSSPSNRTPRPLPTGIG